MADVTEDWRERCYPDDGWDDDAPGVMRVHVAQARAEVLMARHTKSVLVDKARVRKTRVSGRKRDIAWNLVLNGEKP